MTPFPRWRQTALGLVAAAGLAALLLAGAQSLLSLLNSDILYLPALYDDLFVRKLPLIGWVMPPASYLFPDFAVLSLAEAALPSLDAAIVAYAGLAVLSFLGAMTWLLRHVVGDTRRTGALVVASGLVGWLYLQATGADALLAQLLHPSDHAGAAAIGLWTAGLVALAVRRGRVGVGVATALTLLTALTAASDLLLVSQFVAPLVAALGFLAWRRRVPARLAMVTAACLGGGAVAGGLLRAAVRWSEVWHVAPSPWHPEYRLLSVQNMWANGLALAGGHPEAPLALAAWVALWALTLRRAKSAEASLALLATGASVAGTVLGPALFGLYDNGSANRYLAPLFVIPALSLLPLAAALRPRLAAAGSRWLLAAASVGAAAYGGWAFLGPQKAQAPTSYGPDVACLDQLADRFGVEYGYGDYWNAKRLSLLSRRAVRVNQLQRDLTAYWWITDMLWYYEGDSRRRLAHDNRFVITDRLDRDKILRTFGVPAEALTCDHSEYFYYGRETDVAFRTYLPEELKK